MATRQLDARTSNLETLIALAQLLDRVEPNVATIGAEQYRALVRQLQIALRADPIPGDALQAVLRAHPATALIYENMHYERAGLSRAPLDRSITSERLARSALARAAAH